MAYIIKVGSMSVVARTAQEAISIVETLLLDNQQRQPVISNFHDKEIEIEQLRKLVAESDNS
jgi:hypothetical protein